MHHPHTESLQRILFYFILLQSNFPAIYSIRTYSGKLYKNNTMLISELSSRPLLPTTHMQHLNSYIIHKTTAGSNKGNEKVGGCVCRMGGGGGGERMGEWGGGEGK